jgi:hypothetical protein
VKLLVQGGQPVQVDDSLVRAHVHRHADDQSTSQDRGDRKIVPFFDIFQDCLELGRVGRIQHVAPRAALEQPGRVVHRFVFRRAAHPHPDQKAHRRLLFIANFPPDLVYFLDDSVRPFRMPHRLPGKAESAVAIAPDAARGIDFHAEPDQRVRCGVERRQSFAPHARIERAQPFQNALVLESEIVRLRTTLGRIIGKRQKHLLVLSQARRIHTWKKLS